MQERGSEDSENEEAFAGIAFGAGEVNWWSCLEERKKHKTSEARKYTKLQAFCHKGNEGKPKRHKKAKALKKKRQMVCMTISINRKQKRVKRPPTMDGIDLDDFIQRNADPIWLHQNEMWEEMDSEAPEEINDGKSLKSKDWGIF